MRRCIFCGAGGAGIRFVDSAGRPARVCATCQAGIITLGRPALAPQEAIRRMIDAYRARH